MRAQIIQFIIVQNTNSKKLPTRGWVIITHLSIWFRAGESSCKKTIKKKKKKTEKLKAFGTLKDPQWQSNMGNSWCVATPAGLPKCSSAAPPTTEAYSDLPLSYWLHSANIYFCITPLKSHSLTNGKEHKGIRCCNFSSWDYIFSVSSTWDNQKLVFSKTLSDTSDNIIKTTVS